MKILVAQERQKLNGELLQDLAAYSNLKKILKFSKP